MDKSYRRNLLLACLLPLAVVLTRLYFGGFDFSHFIVAGDRFVNAEEHPYQIKIQPHSAGYDGQYFYHLALNPFTTNNREYGISNVLSYRKQRILYPLLSHFLVLGKGPLIPVSMVLVNLIAIIFLFILVNRFIIHANAPPWTILLFACFTGVYISLTRDLSEACEGLFVVMACYYFLKEKIALFSISATLALLSREVSLVILLPGIFMMGHQLFLRGQLIKFKSLWLFVPILIFLSWKIHLHMQFGSSISDARQFVYLPFTGLFDGLGEIFSSNLHPERYSALTHMGYGLFCAVYLSWFFWTIILAAKTLNLEGGSFLRWLKVSWLLWVTFMIFFSGVIYNSDLGFGRILSTFSIICFLMIIVGKVRFPKLYVYFTFLFAIPMLIRLVYLP